MDQVASNVADYVSAQQSVAAALPAAGTAWLDSSRDQARTTLAAVGLPSTRQEDWKYTNIKPITRSLFSPVSRPSRWNDQDFVADAQVSGLDSHRLVFADGILVPELSQCDGLPAGVTVAGMADILQRDAGRAEENLGSTLPGLPHGFTAMNSSFIPDGAFVEIGPGIVLEKPIELLFVSACEGEGRLGLPRNLIVCRSGSRASVIERYLSAVEARSLTNAVSEVILDDGARLTHQRIIDESSRSFHVGGLFARLNRDSRLDAYSVTLGGALVRNDVLVNLDATGATVDLVGLYLSRGRSHVDNHTHVIHNCPGGTSREFYKGILFDRSRAVFHGRITVQPDAQQTDAEQRNQNLLLSLDAEVDTKPQLEIYADDVKCTHGATVGQLNETAVFYLRSRGVSERQARRMLTYAFASEILGRIEPSNLRAYLDQRVSELFSSTGQATI